VAHAASSGSFRLFLMMSKSNDHPRFLTTTPEGCITVSPTEAARALGVSRATIHALISRGELPSLKVGGARKILVVHLEEWIRDQIEAEAASRAQKGA
jgi:excisionase family DNA binding protein